eukprot:CAMPEP_0177758088 /NCGR_PEP_ID=MMETSP0491_2-20121128/4001_1 /TAXON_ID=63592 /ORGANISM="Tetraselmis chuii, Strain PLY429" /LENGTH=724 /DNA_ID=CAMNT_0019273805 /DNA_START=584 /DNA_END=2758 /DNA_ORIENTATION=+
MADSSEDLRLHSIISGFTKKHLDRCLGNLSISKSGNKDACKLRLLDACGINTPTHRIIVEHDRYTQRRAREEVWARVGGKGEAGNSGNSRTPFALTEKLRGEVQCICHDNSKRGHMIQCSAKGCHKLQHVQCVGLSVDAGDKTDFVCETCRVARTDPFKQASFYKVTAKLAPTGARATSAQGRIEAMMGVDQMFRLDAAEKKAIDSGELSLYVCCMMLDDTTNYRFHWPLYSDLRVNNVPYRVYPRSSSTKLGVNGRDNLFSVGRYCYAGSNRVVLTGVDPRPFVLMVVLARSRSLEEVKGLMQPKELIEDAFKRTWRLLNGKNGDADDDIVTLSTVISLKCPLTGARIKTPARFSDVSGLSVFDLDAFLDVAQKTFKWQCPQTMKNSSIENLQIDSYTERILQMLEHTSYNEVEISPEALWRPAGTEQDFRDVQEDPATAKPIEAEAVKEETVLSSDDDDDANILSHKEANAIRSAPKAEDSDVIVIDSSDDEEVQPVSAPSSSTQAASGQNVNGDGRGGMRIVLPAKARGLDNTSVAAAQASSAAQWQQQVPQSGSLQFLPTDCFMQQRQMQQQVSNSYMQQVTQNQHLHQEPQLFMGQERPSMHYLPTGQQQQQHSSASAGPSMGMTTQESQLLSNCQQGLCGPQYLDPTQPQLVSADVSQASTMSAAYGLSQSSPMAAMCDMNMGSLGLFGQDSQADDYNEVLRNDMSDVMDFMGLLTEM